MIEKQSINGKEYWVRVDAHPVKRENAHVIPTEYFTASFFREDPATVKHDGETIKGEDGQAKLFESPVAALSEASRQLENTVRQNQSPY